MCLLESCWKEVKSLEKAAGLERFEISTSLTDLIGTLAAMAEHMLEEEILCPAMLAATSKRYKVPAERIIGWLKPPGYFTGGSFVHMARDNILRGSYEKRMPAMFEIV